MYIGAVIAAGSVALVLVPALAGVALLVAAGVATMRRAPGRGREADRIAISGEPSNDRWRRFADQVGQLDDVDAERRPASHSGVVSSPAHATDDAVGSWAVSGIEREPVAHVDHPTGSSDHRFESTGTHHPEPGIAVRPAELPDDDWPSALPHEEIGDTGPLAALPPSHDQGHRQAS